PGIWRAIQITKWRTIDRRDIDENWTFIPLTLADYVPVRKERPVERGGEVVHSSNIATIFNDEIIN
ncbi:MAG: hypothetical protein ABEI86_14770, partial [Halobacteriaceae archaeon]